VWGRVVQVRTCAGSELRRGRFGSVDKSASQLTARSVWLALTDWVSVLAGKTQNSIHGQINSDTCSCHDADHHCPSDDWNRAAISHSSV